MRWSFLSLTSVLAAAAASCGGGGQHCNTGPDAGFSAPIMTVGGETFSFGLFHSSPNADCALDSVTIEGHQGGVQSGFPITFCLRDPSKIGSSPVSLADTSMNGPVRLEDTSAEAAMGCTIAIGSGAPTGTLTFEGFCTTPEEGFNVTFAASVPGKKTCPADAGPAVVTDVTIQLAGTVAVKNHSLFAP